MCGRGAQLRLPVSNCPTFANRRREKDESHSVALRPFAICTFAVNKGDRGDLEESQRVWQARALAAYADMHKMASLHFGIV